MDVGAEQAYQQRIAELELQNARLEARVADLYSTRQLMTRLIWSLGLKIRLLLRLSPSVMCHQKPGPFSFPIWRKIA